MNEEEMLASISHDMRLTKNFFKSIYCKGMDNPDFPEKAIKRLEEVGCSKAREYYGTWVDKYESEREVMLNRVAHWYAEECRKEARERERKVSALRRARRNLTKEELTELCQKLLQEGVVKTPEQFATAVLQDL